jgi:hypothetical protein
MSSLRAALWVAETHSRALKAESTTRNAHRADSQSEAGTDRNGVAGPPDSRNSEIRENLRPLNVPS